MWGHCSSLLGPGAHKVLFVPSKSLFSHSCISSGGSMVGLMMTSSRRAYATCFTTQVCYTQSPCPCSRPLLTYISTGDTQTLKGRSGSDSVGSLGPGAHKVLFEPSEHLWQVWGVIVNTISVLLTSCWGFSCLDIGYFFFFWWDPTLSCQWLFRSKL